MAVSLVGDRLRATSVVADVSLRGAAVQVTSAVTVDVEGRSESALEAKWVMRAVYAN